MASVSSLDKDLRRVRLDKYTPAAANEVRSWIEDTLGERLPSSDLLEGLKDGVALCKLVNLAVPPPGVKFKQSAMPFVQMENISIFLRACQGPPLNLHQHDTFLTVDLYEQKDPAQVLQCLGAFSRAAHAANPSRFPTAIGPKNRMSVAEPQNSAPSTPIRNRGISVTSNTSSAYGSKPVLSHRTGDSASGRYSPTKSPNNGASSPGPVSSWSKREHEGATSPAWNIAQYGYMGGASQGNLGIAFGARRQITTSGPKVPSLADKERMRKEKEAEEERERLAAEEEERRRRAELEAEEERARLDEERRWEEETNRAREEERRRAEEEKRRWEEEEREWRLTEEKRRREEKEAEERLEAERQQIRSQGGSTPKGSLRSQHTGSGDTNYGDRIKQLEKELEEARQREAEYERERQARSGGSSRRSPRPLPNPTAQPEHVSSPPAHTTPRAPRPLPKPAVTPEAASSSSSPFNAARSPRPLPEPTAKSPPVTSPSASGGGGRPLPDPKTYSSPPSAHASRTDRYLSSNPAPSPSGPQQTYARELGATAEQDGEDRRRVQSQQQTKAGGWASKSLLEREMERERERQREWEEAQKETAAAARNSDGVDGISGGIGGKWDVSQWSGFTGGDGQNKGTQGIGAGRRQIVGPRPLPGPGSKQ
ncbi:uncharacterized protein F5Z01DRAFT_621014 [Emericellopsis atlantica]|uniref:Calponin-homology (CH) domain-containing protein n=1 Tax=Emericellopsis atlantica TaxID=2614577 RepID=A0A9P7ZNU3_9HYPO|nr:uncharacterized protein F5Z01DRAFT_621014 [Emericellopsis atlantica]KAG9254975.1 hypothetical protein F5Z01DRAFT_621014 [Emericellopsis atlantica]